MKLFCAPGTMSLLPHIVLLEAGLPFTQIRINEFTKAIEGGGGYRTVNPLGYVPALLLDDGTLLTEGAAIAQYIADQAPSSGLAPPNGTIERTKLQAWLNFFSSEMHKGSYAPIFHKGLSEDAKDIFRDRLRSRYAHLDRHLAVHEYFMGKDFTIADANSYSITNWAPRVGFDLSPYPNVRAHHARIGDRPAVQAAMKAEGPIPAS